MRTLVRISLPLMFFSFFEMVSVFVERIFLSHHSLIGMASSLNATYLAGIFQGPFVAAASIGQVFVGLYQGSGELKRIGPCTWQLIWFSLLSPLITLPASILTSSLYFQNTMIAQAGANYFGILAWGNFLFPLSAALSSFYLGRGKVLYVTGLLLSSYATHVLLSWYLIFGIDGILPSFGIKGGAIAKCLSLGIVCIILFISFLSKRNRTMFNTDEWQLVYKKLCFYVRHGLARAFAFFSVKTWWVAVSFIVLKKGGQYADVLIIGGTVIGFLQFAGIGLYKATLTISSNLLGAKNDIEVWRLCRSLLIYNGIAGTLLAILIIQFPGALAYFFDASSQQLFNDTFTMINHWIWGHLLAFMLQMSLCALIVSARDLKFQFCCYVFAGLSSFAPVYFTLYQGRWQPDKLWVIMGLENLITAIIFFIRIRKQKMLFTTPEQVAQNKPI